MDSRGGELQESFQGFVKQFDRLIDSFADKRREILSDKKKPAVSPIKKPESVQKTEKKP